MAGEIAYEIEHSPAYASLKVNLQADQSIIVESGGMMAMDPHIKMKSKLKGGLMKSVGRMLGGESLFLSEFTASKKSGRLFIAPGLPGDIQHYYLESNSGKNLVIQSAGFVACSPQVNIDSKFRGLQGFLGESTLFMLKASGQGDVWFSSYGGILEVPVRGDYIVDTGYIVAFEDTLDFQVEVMGGISWKNLKTSILGGEGLVCRFRGYGRLWLQSRHIFSLLNFLYPFRPLVSTSSSDD
jgi:uncharacterized protein (TIGR00266 family)